MFCFVFFFLFLVEISCSIQYKYLQDEPLPRHPRWLQRTLGATEGRGGSEGEGRWGLQAEHISQERQLLRDSHADLEPARSPGDTTGWRDTSNASTLLSAIISPSRATQASCDFTGSTVNVSLSLLGFNLSENKFGTANRTTPARLSVKQHKPKKPGMWKEAPWGCLPKPCLQPQDASIRPKTPL